MLGYILALVNKKEKNIISDQKTLKNVSELTKILHTLC